MIFVDGYSMFDLTIDSNGLRGKLLLKSQLIVFEEAIAFAPALH